MALYGHSVRLTGTNFVKTQLDHKKIAGGGGGGCVRLGDAITKIKKTVTKRHID